MAFIDISMVPVPKARREAFLAFSARMAAVYRDHGASRIIDYWQAEEPSRPEDFHADGADYDEGELSEIGDLLGRSESEFVVVTIMEWPSRGARDRGVAAATKDPRVLATLDEDPVFDGGRVVGESFTVALTDPAAGNEPG